MGLDLKLLPVTHTRDGAPSSSHSIIHINRNSDLWPAIQALPSRDIPEGFMSYLGDVSCASCEERHFGETQLDPYGDLLRYVKAGTLAALATHNAVKDSDENRAAWAYLAALDPSTSVVLYWC